MASFFGRPQFVTVRLSEAATATRREVRNGVNRRRFLRGPGESYSDVILRLVELKAAL
jgi:hypothetical protein